MSVEEIERYIQMCTYIDPDTMSIGGIRKAAEGIAKELAAQQSVQADEDYCQHDWSFPPELCPVCGKRVPVIRLRR